MNQTTRQRRSRKSSRRHRRRRRHGGDTTTNDGEEIRIVFTKGSATTLSQKMYVTSFAAPSGFLDELTRMDKELVNTVNLIKNGPDEKEVPSEYVIRVQRNTPVAEIKNKDEKRICNNNTTEPSTTSPQAASPQATSPQAAYDR